MKYKNANIKTIEELMHRLINGEVFKSTNGCTIHFSLNDPKINSNPFIVISQNIVLPPGRKLNIFDFDMSKLEIEIDWKDNVSIENPVWCWVGDSEKQASLKRISPRAINKFSTKSDRCFIDQHSMGWKFAEPIKKGEITFWDDNDGE